MTKYSNNFVKQFNALGDETRIAVINRLTLGELSVTQLANDFSMKLPSFYSHLKILEEAELISTEKKGRVRYCALQKQTFDKMQNWFETKKTQWVSRLDNIEKLLEE